LLGGALARAARIRTAIDELAGLSLMGREVVAPGKAFDLDPMVLTMDVRGLGISGYQATEWLRANCHVDIGSADSRRMSARLSYADDDETERRLIESLHALIAAADSIEKPPPVHLPQPGGLELENVMLPRDAFFGRVEQVPVEEAAGRIAAEMVSPYPPGVPVLAPGERISQDALDYLTSGVAAGMLIPDAADSEMKTVRVVAE
jgi:arginine/lysine/ornithine decarboxylase